MSFPIGVEKQAFDTPILCIDMDLMESNIRKMAAFCKENGVDWRPHSKCHKTPVIAQMEITAGAIGVTSPKVSEAEVLALGGVKDILIANMIVGVQKWERVAALRRIADPIIACDHYAQVEPLAAICHKRGVNVRVIIEVDIGLNRVGSCPGKPTVELAQAISKLKGVTFAGIMGYEGHLLRIESPEEKVKQIEEAISILAHTKEQLTATGISCPIVSAGGTGSFHITAKCPGVTELQAGGGIFMDPFYRNSCQVQGLDYALTVLATVVSRPSLDRAVLDCGRKTMNPDVHVPLVVGYEDATIKRMSAEHCELNLGSKSQDLKIGDKIELVVGYGDFTTVLHDNFFAFRNNCLEAVYPIAGRGKLQ